MVQDARPPMPKAQTVYGGIIYWMAILAAIICMIGPVIAMASPDNNVLNPHYLFSAIFEGKNSEEVWKAGGAEFPGGHFWMSNLGTGDGLTQFGLALGCSCAFWGLLATAACYLIEKPRVVLYMLLSLWVATLIALSATGAVSGGH